MTILKTSRQRLLDYLATQKSMTALEVSRGLKMTPANARHHLAVLEAEGLVEAAGLRPGRGRGRPALMYRLSSQALGQTLSSLASALLDELLAGLPVDEKERALRRLAARLGRDLPDPNRAGGPALAGGNRSLTQRLYAAVQRLNDLNYQARWEARPDGPRLSMVRCPYAEILQEHPELCRMDALLLEHMLGSPVQQTARLERGPDGLPHCAFRLLPLSAPTPTA